MRRTPLLILLAAIVQIGWGSVAQADEDLLVQQFHITVETNYNFFDKTLKEAASPEGKAIIGTIATYFGVPSSVVGLAAAEIQQSRSGEEYRKFVASPPGYTICFAQPTGSQYNGVETTEDSTFNAVIFRPIPGRVSQDGLGIYMAVPNKVGRRVRAESTFNVTFVKDPPGFTAHSQCRPTGEAAWLSRNNGTRLNVPCPTPSLCP